MCWQCSHFCWATALPLQALRGHGGALKMELQIRTLTAATSGELVALPNSLHPLSCAPGLSPPPGSAYGGETFICLPFQWSLSCTHDKEPARQLSDCIFLQFLAQTFSFICKAAISHSSVPTHCLMYNHILQRMNLSTQLLCYE